MLFKLNSYKNDTLLVLKEFSSKILQKFLCPLVRFSQIRPVTYIGEEHFMHLRMHTVIYCILRFVCSESFTV